MLIIGNTHQAQQLAARLDAQFSLLSAHPFPDGEVDLHLDPTPAAAPSLIYYQFSADESFDAQILRLTSLLYTLPRQSSLSLVLPYLPYARALPFEMTGIVASIQPLFLAIQSCVSHLYVLELHCPIEFLQQYIKPAEALEISMCLSISDFIKNKFKEVVLVSPDEGSASRVQCVAASLGAASLIMQKERKSATDVSIISTGQEAAADLSKTHVIIDDIISTGGTLKKAAAKLRQLGVNDIACIITHNVAQETTLQSFIADSIPLFTSNSLLRSSLSQLDVLDAVVAEVSAKVKAAT